MPSSLTIHVRQTTVVTLVGRLDAATSPRAEEALKPLLASAPKNVLLDLAGLEFISSAGLRVFMSTRKALGDSGSECLIVNMQPQIARVLEVMKHVPGMRLFASTREADSYLAAIQERVLKGE